MAIFLSKDNFKQKWEETVSFHNRLRKPYDELERIKNNQPHSSIDPSYPKTTDGTTASQVRQIPRRAIQQLPYGAATVRGDKALSCLADYTLKHEIIPNSQTQDIVLAKVWSAVEDIVTFGSADSFVFYKNEGDYFGTDFRKPYKRDCFTEAGKGTFSESNIYFIRTYWQESDIDSQIDKEEKLAKAAKKRGEKYESTWDTVELKKVKESDGKEKDPNEQSDTEKDRDIRHKAYRFIHGFQKGKKAKFFTYCEETSSFVREWTTNDPRGVMPVNRIYFENDMSNPDGRGIVELVAPLQNYLDSTLQAWQYSQIYNLSPALMKWGKFNSAQVKLRPKAIIEMGDNMNNKLDAFTIDSSAITNFSNTYGLIKSQILNLFGGDDQAVSATVGNPGFSKTDAGVNARQEVVNINRNVIQKRVEDWLGETWCTQLNIYFQVTKGDRTFYPDDKELKKLAQYESEYYTIQDNALIVHFSAIEDKEFDFEVEASTSKKPDNDDAKDRFNESLKTLAETGLIQQLNPIELIKRILIDNNVDNVDELLPQPQAQGAGQAQAQGDLPDEQIVQNLIQAGYPEQIAMQGLQLEKQGYTPEQIDQVLQKMMGQQNG